MEGIFSGSAVSTVSGSGEIHLPPTFSSVIRRIRPDTLLIRASAARDRLVVGSKAALFHQQELATCQQGGFVGETSLEHDRWARRTFTFVDRVELADGDRITLSPIMKERGRIGSAVLLVGMGPQFEIWDLSDVIACGPYDLAWLASRHLKAIKAKTTNVVPLATDRPLRVAS